MGEGVEWGVGRGRSKVGPWAKGRSEGRGLGAQWGVEPPPGNIKVSASGMAEPGAPGTDGSWRPEHRASGV